MLLSLLPLAFLSTLWAVVASPLAKRDFGPVTLFTPPSTYANERTLYARSLLLKDGSVLATWENYDWSGQPYFPIYKSTDHGYTWKELSRVKVCCCISRMVLGGLTNRILLMDGV
jgi:hypothetical protein